MIESEKPSLFMICFACNFDKTAQTHTHTHRTQSPAAPCCPLPRSSVKHCVLASPTSSFSKIIASSSSACNFRWASSAWRKRCIRRNSACPKLDIHMIIICANTCCHGHVDFCKRIEVCIWWYIYIYVLGKCLRECVCVCLQWLPSKLGKVWQTLY